MKKFFNIIFAIICYLVAGAVVIILYSIFGSSVSTGLRWFFWIIFIGGLWLVAWIVARRRGKSLSDIWNEKK
ncbi:MAG: hypothetical protein AUK06_03080 [Parcubacteria group bacterium CG2_30_36_18]|nr:MAG: hypothetical protein AUK06_03080 [Parcubacteria group bacterium CG2_30_36_18]